MTPLEILENIGKLLAFMGVALFVVVSALAQWTFWINDERKHFANMPKKYKVLFMFGKWEFFFLMGVMVLVIIIALVRVLWRMVTTGW